MTRHRVHDNGLRQNVRLAFLNALICQVCTCMIMVDSAIYLMVYSTFSSYLVVGHINSSRVAYYKPRNHSGFQVLLLSRHSPLFIWELKDIHISTALILKSSQHASLRVAYRRIPYSRCRKWMSECDQTDQEYPGMKTA
uniref:Uncharacterized protein n=1 Tax=Strigamia maritima TaxID=126957 RepID=T1JNI7_STRMM